MEDTELFVITSDLNGKNVTVDLFPQMVRRLGDSEGGSTSFKNGLCSGTKIRSLFCSIVIHATKSELVLSLICPQMRSFFFNQP